MNKRTGPKVLRRRPRMDEKPHPIKAWIICARPFALVWVATNTLLGVKLAGFSFEKWLLSFLIVGSVLTTAHFFNSYVDFVKGFDKVEGGSKPKPYTAGNQVLPRGWLSPRTVKISTYAWLMVSLILMSFAPRRIDVYLLYALGVFVAFAYSLWFKPKGFGEVALFLGHGFGASTLAYALVKPVDSTALAIGVLLGLWAAMFYTLDQLPDVETDFSKRVKNLAYIMLKAQIKPSSYVWFVGSATATLTAAFVIAGFLPTKFLSALGVLPLMHIAGIIIDYDFDKGVLLFLVAMWLYTLIPAIVL